MCLSEWSFNWIGLGWWRHFGSRSGAVYLTAIIGSSRLARVTSCLSSLTATAGWFQSFLVCVLFGFVLDCFMFGRLVLSTPATHCSYNNMCFCVSFSRFAFMLTGDMFFFLLYFPFSLTFYGFLGNLCFFTQQPSNCMLHNAVAPLDCFLYTASNPACERKVNESIASPAVG